VTAEGRDSWLELQRKREELMRYQVLRMLYEATSGIPEVKCNVAHFAFNLATWRSEVFRIVEWLERSGFIRYCGAGPTVCITDKGVASIQEQDRRRSIRDEDALQ
jgi:DNA-binding IclR family transcriptional regulator